jgi:hypothetical protein
MADDLGADLDQLLAQDVLLAMVGGLFALG